MSMRVTVCLVLQAIAIFILGCLNISTTRQIERVRQNTYDLAHLINEKFGTASEIPILLPGQKEEFVIMLPLKSEGK